MRLTSDIFERLPQVWILVGLLIITSGVYLGFDYSVIFIYLGVGILSFVYGVALFVLLQFEKPKKSNKRTLSRDFISVGETVVMPAQKEEPEPESALTS